MTSFQLVQINVGRLLAHIDDPLIEGFKSNLDRLNAIADATPGFIWRLVGDGNNATDIQPVPADPLFAINLSVWRDLDALAGFVYRSDHRDVMRRRREWFEPMDVFMALWWVPAGHRPTPAEALARLNLLARMGPTSDAFTFRQPFPSPGVSTITPVLDECA